MSWSFLHSCTYIFQSLRDGLFDELKICAMLAVCSKFMPSLSAQYRSADQAGKCYADFVRRELPVRISQGAHIDTIQCLLLIAMYEWGEQSGFSAWMYLGKRVNSPSSMAETYRSFEGMAIRMSQALRPQANLRSSTSNISPELAVIRQETRNRTIWSCFAMDRLFSGGKDRPTVFVSEEMVIPLPLSESDYAFGEIKEQRKNMSVFLESNTTETPWTMEHHFTIILRGVDIWSTLSKWTGRGGMKRYHGPNDCPWEPTSAWNKISRDLEIWRNSQDERVKFSPIRIAAQLHQGQREAFAFINLLYYLWYVKIFAGYLVTTINHSILTNKKSDVPTSNICPLCPLAIIKCY
jgi:hypothetical protein